jgi:hypothetical protein
VSTDPWPPSEAESLARLADIMERVLEILEDWAKPRMVVVNSDDLDAEELHPAAEWNIAGVDR